LSPYVCCEATKNAAVGHRIADPGARPARHAKCIASLDSTVGRPLSVIGGGWNVEEKWRTTAPDTRPVHADARAHFGDEGLWDAGGGNPSGEFVNFDRCGPCRQPASAAPPILLGGESDSTRAPQYGRNCDGWIPASGLGDDPTPFTPEHQGRRHRAACQTRPWQRKVRGAIPNP